MGIRENTPQWYFFKSYVGTALWSTNDESDESAGDPMDANYDDSDISPDTLATMESDCLAFYAANVDHIHCDDAPLSQEFEGRLSHREAARAGHDFWLTRCGHGAGFWDGDWPEPHASALDLASKAYGNVDLYVGDDGEIYAS